MEPPSPPAASAAEAPAGPEPPKNPVRGRPGCTAAAEGQRQMRRQEGVVKPVGGRERPELAKISARARSLHPAKPGTRRDRDMGSGRRRTPGEA